MSARVSVAYLGLVRNVLDCHEEEVGIPPDTTVGGSWPFWLSGTGLNEIQTFPTATEPAARARGLLR